MRSLLHKLLLSSLLIIFLPMGLAILWTSKTLSSLLEALFVEKSTAHTEQVKLLLGEKRETATGLVHWIAEMPGVKKLHQSSENNSKASYIMGHSFQALSVLVCTAGGHVAAVPLVSRIHEGLVWFPGDRRSLLDKLAAMFLETVSHDSRLALLVADAYYASGKVIRPLLQKGHHLLTRVRKNAVAYQKAEVAKTIRRGRPKTYGKKVKLRHYFDHPKKFIQALSPVYGETQTPIWYRTEDLLWRPIGRLVRFVWVIHPTRGKMILMF